MNGRESRLKENMVYLFRVFGKWNKSKCYTKASYNSSSCGIVTFCEANYSKIAWHSVVFPSFFILRHLPFCTYLCNNVYILAIKKWPCINIRSVFWKYKSCTFASNHWQDKDLPISRVIPTGDWTCWRDKSIDYNKKSLKPMLSKSIFQTDIQLPDCQHSGPANLKQYSKIYVNWYWF